MRVAQALGAAIVLAAHERERSLKLVSKREYEFMNKAVVRCVTIIACLAGSYLQQLPSAAAEDGLRIGAILGLTVSSSAIGAEVRQGMDLCADSSTRILVEDSRGQPALGVTAFRKLVEQDKVDVSVVTFSGVAGAIVPIAREKQAPVMLTLVSTRGVVQDTNQDIFRFFTSGEQEGPIMARYLSSRRQIRKAAILHIEDEYGLSYANAFTAEFQGGGGNVVISESYSRETSDFRALLVRIRAKKTDAIYVIGHDAHVVNILRQARELGLKELLASNWILASPTVRHGQEGLFEGVVFTSPDFYWAATPHQQAFAKSFFDRYGVAATAYAALGCDVVDLIERQPAKSFGKALSQLSNYRGVIGEVSSASDGSLEFPLYPVEFRRGKMVVATGAGNGERAERNEREQAAHKGTSGVSMHSKKIVIDVGQCDPDHASIKRVVEQCGVTVERAHSGEEAKKLLASGNVGLVLVNRVLDADGSDGMAIIKELAALGKAPVMLVSNYPEYQEKAVAMGALSGFGKSSLREPGTLAMLKQVLEK